MIIRPVFRFHVALVVVLWAILLPLHIHLSGYGLTNYLWWMDWLRPTMTALGIPGLNAYNIPVNCGLAVCGYTLTNWFHGAACVLVALTVALLFASFSLGWYLYLSSVATVAIALGWEVWEISTGITHCDATVFNSIAQVCGEMMRSLTDTVMDLTYGFIGVFVVCMILFAIDRHAPEVEY